MTTPSRRTDLLPNYRSSTRHRFVAFAMGSCSLLLAACPGDEPADVPIARAVETIDSEGGEVAVGNATILVPPGALAEGDAVDITIEEYPSVDGSDGVPLISSGYELGPHGQTFLGAGVALNIVPTSPLAEGTYPEIATLGHDGTWQVVETSYQEADGSVTAWLEHFSHYGIVTTNVQRPLPLSGIAVDNATFISQYPGSNLVTPIQTTWELTQPRVRISGNGSPDGDAVARLELDGTEIDFTIDSQSFAFTFDYPDVDVDEVQLSLWAPHQPMRHLLKLRCDAECRSQVTAPSAGSITFDLAPASAWTIDDSESFFASCGGSGGPVDNPALDVGKPTIVQHASGFDMLETSVSGDTTQCCGCLRVRRTFPVGQNLLSKHASITIHADAQESDDTYTANSWEINLVDHAGNLKGAVKVGMLSTNAPDDLNNCGQDVQAPMNDATYTVQLGDYKDVEFNAVEVVSAHYTCVGSNSLRLGEVTLDWTADAVP